MGHLQEEISAIISIIIDELVSNLNVIIYLLLNK